MDMPGRRSISCTVMSMTDMDNVDDDVADSVETIAATEEENAEVDIQGGGGGGDLSADIMTKKKISTSLLTAAVSTAVTEESNGMILVEEEEAPETEGIETELEAVATVTVPTEKTIATSEAIPVGVNGGTHSSLTESQFGGSNPTLNSNGELCGVLARGKSPPGTSFAAVGSPVLSEPGELLGLRRQSLSTEDVFENMKRVFRTSETRRHDIASGVSSGNDMVVMDYSSNSDFPPVSRHANSLSTPNLSLGPLTFLSNNNNAINSGSVPMGSSDSSISAESGSSDIQTNGNKSIGAGVVGSNRGSYENISNVGMKKKSPTTHAKLATLKILIPDCLCGFIIGAQGATIQELEKMSGASIHVASAHTMQPGQTDRLVTITGTIVSNQRAQYLISIKVQEAENGPVDRYQVPNDAASSVVCEYTGMHMGGASASASAMNGTSAMAVEVPNYLVGMLIGRRGESIREIEHSSGCKVVIESDGDSLPCSSTRSVTIIGPPTNLERCRVLIFAHLSAASSRSTAGVSSSSPYGFSGHGLGDPFMIGRGGTYMDPSHMAGYIIGKGGSTVQEIQHRAGVVLDIAPAAPGEHAMPNAERDVTIRGTPSGISTAQTLVSAKLHEGGMMGRGGQQQTRYFGNNIQGPSGIGMEDHLFDAHGLGNGTINGDAGLDRIVEQMVHVPSSLVGFIIGKGGASVRDMTERSGSCINIAKENQPGSAFRSVTLVGTVQNNNIAAMLIDRKCQEAAQSPSRTSPLGYTFVPDNNDNEDDQLGCSGLNGNDINGTVPQQATTGGFGSNSIGAVGMGVPQLEIAMSSLAVGQVQQEQHYGNITQAAPIDSTPSHPGTATSTNATSASSKTSPLLAPMQFAYSPPLGGFMMMASHNGQ